MRESRVASPTTPAARATREFSETFASDMNIFLFIGLQSIQTCGDVVGGAAGYSDYLCPGQLTGDDCHLPSLNPEKIGNSANAFLIGLSIHRWRRYPDLKGIILKSRQFRAGCTRHNADSEGNAVFSGVQWNHCMSAEIVRKLKHAGHKEALQKDDQKQDDNRRKIHPQVSDWHAAS
jgi:hypothetical protein